MPAIDAWRKQAVEKRNLQEYGYLMEYNRQTIPGASDMNSLKEQMKQALLQMPERRRTIFLLRKEYGLSSFEIAEKLNISQQAVRRHLDEAVGLLKKHLSAADLFMLLMNAGPVAFSLNDFITA